MVQRAAVVQVVSHLVPRVAMLAMGGIASVPRAEDVCVIAVSIPPGCMIVNVVSCIVPRTYVVHVVSD